MSTLTRPFRVVESELVSYRRTWRGTVISSFVNPVLFLSAMGLSLGSLVAFITYFGSIGMLLLVHQIAGSSVGFVATAFSPFVIAATIVAREVSIWVGLLIARRGTRLKERNRVEREAFDAEQGDTKASDGATATSSANAGA